MKSSFEKIPLGKLSKIFSGFAFKSADLTDNPDDTYPIIKIANIQNKKVLKFGSGYLPKDQFVEKLEKYKLDKDDFLVAMTGAGSVGKVGKMRNPDQTYLVNQRVGIVRSDKSKVDPEYLFQVLSHDYYEEYLYQLGIGSGQPNVSATDIGELEVPYPDMEIQREIATTLSAFDDLIENNTRRIEILEEMAQLFYREWFVHYRYPGHENDKLVDSGTDLGKIPEGWEVKRIDDVVGTIGGGTPRRKNEEYWSDGNITWYTPSDLTAEETMFMDHSSECINELGLKKSSAKLFPPHSVMMTSRATIGVISINTSEACTNQGFITCVPNKRLNKYQIYFWLKEIMPRIEQYASGATYKEINKTTFRDIETIVPDITISEAFYGKIDPIGKLIQTLQQQNKKLKETRDLLLPKLISGKIEVESL